MGIQPEKAQFHKRLALPARGEAHAGALKRTQARAVPRPGVVKPQAHDASGVAKREFGGNVPAHRKTHHVGALHTRSVQNARGVIRHVRQGISRRGRRTLAHPPVVEDDAAVICAQQGKLRRPEGVVMARSAHQQERRPLSLGLIENLYA